MIPQGLRQARGKSWGRAGVGWGGETLLTAAQCQLESESKAQPVRGAGGASIT